MNPTDPIRAIQARPNIPYLTLALVALFCLALGGCGAPPASTWSQAEEWVCETGRVYGQTDGTLCSVYGLSVPDGAGTAIFDECYGVAYELSFALAECGE